MTVRRRPNKPTLQQHVVNLQAEITSLKTTLGTLIAWLPQSANSPISGNDAMRLLTIMNSTRPYVSADGE